jgi:type IV fimbrial biogenesis protein FimT
VLNRATLRRGFTLIELLITLTIVGIVLALGAPAFGAWIQNTQIRSAAESMLTGIKLARTEAAKSNCASHFQLTDTGGNPSTTGPYWLVSSDAFNDAGETKCDPTQPQIIRQRNSNDGTANAAYAVTFPLPPPSSIAFDALGRINTDLVIDITNPTGGACVASSGPMRCLRILVTPGGQARMCDPAVSDANDSRKC